MRSKFEKPGKYCIISCYPVKLGYGKCFDLLILGYVCEMDMMLLFVDYTSNFLEPPCILISASGMLQISYLHGHKVPSPKVIYLTV